MLIVARNNLKFKYREIVVGSSIFVLLSLLFLLLQEEDLRHSLR